MVEAVNPPIITSAIPFIESCSRHAEYIGTMDIIVVSVVIRHGRSLDFPADIRCFLGRHAFPVGISRIHDKDPVIDNNTGQHPGNPSVK